MPTYWSQDRVATLSKLWLDGVSASGIAKRLGGGVTRNAVIGKIYRLGLSGRGAPAEPRVGTRRLTRSAPVAPPRPRIASPGAASAPPQPRASTPIMVCEEERGGVSSIDGLGPCMCKWPLGDPRLAGFSFCGAVAADGPYCNRHAALGVRPGAAQATRSDRRLIDYLRRIGAVAA